MAINKFLIYTVLSIVLYLLLIIIIVIAIIIIIILPTIILIKVLFPRAFSVSSMKKYTVKTIF